MKTSNNNQIYEILRKTRNSFPELIKVLALNEEEKLKSWKNTLDTKLIPQMDPDFPLMVAVCGGGSSGKSTLFNSLIKKHISSAGGKAGLSRRVLVAIHPEQLKKEKFLANLFNPFGTIPKELKETNELTEPGDPLYIADECVPKNIILLDTPDFDTGHKEEYTNRQTAQKVLEASSVLIYIFTNATYNNRANKEFLSKMLSECGNKKSILVYRCYESYKHEEVISHTENVGKHLYGDEHQKHILGVYRTNDHNEVASGIKYMEFNAVKSDLENIHDLLNSLDPRTLRKEELNSSLNKYVEFLKEISSNAKISLKKLEVYTDVCRITESYAITDALKDFPAKDFTSKLAKEWERTSPKFIKFARNTGKVVSSPIRGILWVAKKTKEKISGENNINEKEINIKDVYSNNIFNAANDLRNGILTSEMIVKASKNDDNVNNILSLIKEINCQKFSYEEHSSNYNIAAETHKSLKETRNKIREINLDKLSKSCNEIVEKIQILPATFDNEIAETIKDFRSTMGFKKKFRELFFASLNTLPTLVAVTYVLFTYDPVGTAGIYAKLQGLFGLNDLFALIAIPASTGLNETDRKQLEELIKPVFEKWFAHRKNEIKSFLRINISEQLFDESKKIQKKIQKLINEIDESVLTFKEFINE